MTFGEVKQLNAKLQQQIQGKQSVSMFSACEILDTETPCDRIPLASSEFTFESGMRTYWSFQNKKRIRKHILYKLQGK